MGRQSSQVCQDLWSLVSNTSEFLFMYNQSVTEAEDVEDEILFEVNEMVSYLVGLELLNMKDRSEL